MSRCKLFLVNPPTGSQSTTLRPVEPEHRIPQRFTAIPGYHERKEAVIRGEEDAWWGTEYEANGPFPMDFVDVAPIGLVAVSDRLRTLLEENGVQGIRFSTVRVGETSMHIMGVRGKVDVNPQAMELQLMEGAEIGLYKGNGLYVSPRLMTILKKNKIKMFSRCAVKEP